MLSSAADVSLTLAAKRKPRAPRWPGKWYGRLGVARRQIGLADQDTGHDATGRRQADVLHANEKPRTLLRTGGAELIQL
jgi:hypothetical protein